MMSRPLTALLLLTLSTTACALPGRGKTAAYVIDVAIAGAGIAAMSADCDSRGEYLPSECDINQSFGTLLIVGGVIGALVNATLMPSAPAERDEPGIAMEGIDCQTALARWRAEPDAVRKTEIYESIPAWCRAEVERSSDVEASGAAQPHAFDPPGAR